MIDRLRRQPGCFQIAFWLAAWLVFITALIYILVQIDFWWWPAGD